MKIKLAVLALCEHGAIMSVFSAAKQCVNFTVKQFCFSIFSNLFFPDILRSFRALM